MGGHGSRFDQLASWEVQQLAVHDLKRNIHYLESQMGVVGKMSANSLKRCRYGVIDTTGFGFEQYFILIDDEWVCDFSGVEFNSSMVTLSKKEKKTKTGYVVEKEYKLGVEESNDLKSRLLMILGSTSYSLCTRNCEHVSYFLTTGYWYSSQISVESDKNNLFRMMVKHLSAHEQKSFIPPKDLYFNDEERKKYGISLTAHRKKMGETPDQPLGYLKYEGSWFVNYECSDDSGEFIKEDTQVILILGSTGVGKSRLINVIFNQDVADSDSSATSVTRGVKFYYGSINGSTIINKPIVLIDTMGFVDTDLSMAQIFELLQNNLRIKLITKCVNQVWIVLGSRLELEHRKAINKFIMWLNLENNKDNVLLIRTKCDGLSEVKRHKIISSYLAIPEIKSLYCHQNLERLGDLKGMRVDNLISVGFPSSEDYEEPILKLQNPQILLDYEQIIFRCAVLHDPIKLSEDGWACWKRLLRM